MRVRGNSAQIYEKYQQLARDASSSGDRIAAENFYQHAEHYYRLLEATSLSRRENGHDGAQQPSDDRASANGEAAGADGGSGTEEAAVIAAAANSEDTASQDDTAPVASTGNGAAEGAADGGDVTPVRRSRLRRANGLADDKPAPKQAGDETAAEESAETPADDANSVNP